MRGARTRHSAATPPPSRGTDAGLDAQLLAQLPAQRVAARDSPGSTLPPGSSQPPASSGGDVRRAASSRPDPSITTPATTTRSGHPPSLTRRRGTWTRSVRSEPNGPRPGARRSGGGIAAGTMNAVVGAGSLVSFPALLAIGVPAVTANVTNTVGLLPGSARSGRRLSAPSSPVVGRRCVRLSIAAAIGGLAGGVLLLASRPRRSRRSCRCSWCSLASSRRCSPRCPAGWPLAPPCSRHGGPVLFLAVGLTAVYGGYFGAAQGVILLALLGSLLEPDVQQANAIKNVLALVTNGVAALLFISGRTSTGRSPRTSRSARSSAESWASASRAACPPWPSGGSSSSSR